MTRRMRTVLVFAASGVLLGVVGLWGAELMRADAKHEGVGDTADDGPLTSSQYAAAVAVAQREMDKERARVTSVTAVIRPGKVRQPNLGGECRSGHVIRILLIGRFPHIVVDPPPGAPAGPVTSVGITADATSGEACLLGVGNVHVHPYRHAADLLPALHR